MLLSQGRKEKKMSVAAIALATSSSSPTFPSPSPFNYRLYVSSHPAVPLFVGASSQAEPSCDIVCHCRITALAPGHEHADDTEEATLATCFITGYKPVD